MGSVILQVWPRWLNKEQASLYTGYSVRQLEIWMRDGVLPYSKPQGNRSPRFDVKDLDYLMEKDKIDIEKQKRRVVKTLVDSVK